MFFRTVLIVALTALTLAAQGRARPERSFRGPSERRVGPNRERIVAQLHEFRSKRLQQSLGLTEEKANAIANRWSQFDEISMTRRREMAQLRQQMNGALMGPGTEEEKNKKIEPIVGQLAGLRQQQQYARKHFEEEVQATLTPAQQGRFILLMDEFQKSLQEAIQEQRRDK